MIPRLVLVLTENWALLPGAPPQQTLATLARWAREAEAAGFDGVVAGQAIRLGLHPGDTGVAARPVRAEQAPPRPSSQRWPAALTQLAAMAACTSRIRIHAPAVITARDHPVLLAKDFATLDQLSAGRLVVQPLVSQNRREYDRANVPFESRHARLEEMLEIWEATWKSCATGGSVSYRGRYFSFDDVAISPGPFREAGPPIWLGPEALHPKLIRRLVRFGSGYAPLGRPSLSALVQLADAMDSDGRPASSLELVATVENPSRDSAKPSDLRAALAPIPSLMNLGFGTFCIKPAQFLEDPKDIGSFCGEVVARTAQLMNR